MRKLVQINKFSHSAPVDFLDKLVYFRAGLNAKTLCGVTLCGNFIFFRIRIMLGTGKNPANQCIISSWFTFITAQMISS